MLSWIRWGNLGLGWEGGRVEGRGWRMGFFVVSPVSVCCQSLLFVARYVLVQTRRVKPIIKLRLDQMHASPLQPALFQIS